MVFNEHYFRELVEWFCFTTTEHAVRHNCMYKPKQTLANIQYAYIIYTLIPYTHIVDLFPHGSTLSLVLLFSFM